jgi:hypothetical protein
MSANFGGQYGARFGMSKNRFKDIRRLFQMNTKPVGNDVNDKWWEIRALIEAFNSNRATTIVPGKYLVIDEIMSMWLGLDGVYAVEGIPHLTKIARKPRGIGLEMKALCDGASGIMIGLELVECKEDMKNKDLQSAYGAGTAVCLRLTKPWAGSKRILIADSAFSSVKTLEALHDKRGLYFMGMVKTAHKRYPKDFFSRWYNDGWDPNPRRDPGSFKVMHLSNSI